MLETISPASDSVTTEVFGTEEVMVKVEVAALSVVALPVVVVSVTVSYSVLAAGSPIEVVLT